MKRKRSPNYAAFRVVALVATLGASFVASSAIAGPPQWLPAAEASHTVSYDSARGREATLYFGADDGIRGTELWRSDGSARGTSRVKDVLPGRNGSSPHFLTGIAGTLYFVAQPFYRDMDPEYEVFRSDGTRTGTRMLADTGCHGGEGESPAYPRSPVGLNGLLLFSSCDGQFDQKESGWGRELWRSDGTRAGTGILTQINPSGTAAVSDLIVANDLMFFGAWDGVHGYELWGSDGTAHGTYMIEDIRPDNNDLCCSGALPIRAAGGTVFVAANDGVNGRELWRSDGTAAGTYMVKDINPSGSSFPSQLSTTAHGVLYFAAGDGVHGKELWRSDGTEAGTYIVEDINPTGSSLPGSIPPARRNVPSAGRPSFEAVNGILYFSASDGVSGVELWRTDGTEAGTWRVKNINPTGRSSPHWLTGLKGHLLFAANDGKSGVELWRSDGTRAGTVKVKNISGDGSSYPGDLTRFKRWVFFRAMNVKEGPPHRPLRNMELWRTDGTRTGTKLLRDLNVGSGSSTPHDFEVVK